MQSITLPNNGTLAATSCRRHRNLPLTSLTIAKGQWKLYGVTPKQSRFWRSLADTEKEKLVRRGRRACFYCALEVAMSEEKSMEDELYRSLVRSLLLDSWPGRTTRRS